MSNRLRLVAPNDGRWTPPKPWWLIRHQVRVLSCGETTATKRRTQRSAVSQLRTICIPCALVGRPCVEVHEGTLRLRRGVGHWWVFEHTSKWQSQRRRGIGVWIAATHTRQWGVL